jgi:hypothetical protein
MNPRPIRAFRARVPTYKTYYSISKHTKAKCVPVRLQIGTWCTYVVIQISRARAIYIKGIASGERGYRLIRRAVHHEEASK